MASEAPEQVGENPERHARAQVIVEVVDERTVRVSGMSPREMVDLLQSRPGGEFLTITAASSPTCLDQGPLSNREADIVRLITAGLGNQDIADRLFLSVNTVKTYIRSSYRKMRVTSRSQAVLWGVRHGFALEPSGESA